MTTTTQGQVKRYPRFFYILLPVLLILTIFILFVHLNYTDTYLSIPDRMKTFYETRLQNITYLMSLAGKDKLNEPQGQTDKEVNEDLTNLETLINEYNEVAEKSNGALEEYKGKTNSVFFLSWALKRVVNNAMDKAGILQGLISGLAGLNSTVSNRNGDDNEDVGSSMANNPKTSKIISGDLNAKRRLLLFSTWLDIPDKRQAQENVLRTWKFWSPLITPLVFTNDPKIRKQALEHGWEVLKEPKTSCGGVPILREMFRMAMKKYNSSLYGFVNSDLLLGAGLLSTVEALVSNSTMMGSSLMAVVKRINVDFKTRAPVYDVDNIAQIANEGLPMSDGSSDGIFTNQHFPWDHVPDIVPGRIGIAMWMVSYARDMGAKVIDISGTVKVIHMMTTKAGNREAWGHKKPRCNHDIYNRMQIKPQSWFCGKIDCAKYKTVRVDETGQSVIQVIDKTQSNHPRCGECHMNLTTLMKTVF